MSINTASLSCTGRLLRPFGGPWPCVLEAIFLVKGNPGISKAAGPSPPCRTCLRGVPACSGRARVVDQPTFGHFDGLRGLRDVAGDLEWNACDAVLVAVEQVARTNG